VYVFSVLLKSVLLLHCLSSSLLSVQRLDLLLIELVVLTLHPVFCVQIQVFLGTVVVDSSCFINSEIIEVAALASADLDSPPLSFSLVYTVLLS